MNRCGDCGGFNGDSYCYRNQMKRSPDSRRCNKFTIFPYYLRSDYDENQKRLDIE